MSQLFASGGQSIGALASASVLPMTIQDWFPLGWTGLISLYTCICLESTKKWQITQFQSFQQSAVQQSSLIIHLNDI